MKKGQKLWTRDELILAINLYLKLPFGRMHRGNPDVVELAQLLNRTPNSVAYKLVNFASLDPSLQARGIKGASNTSKLDRDVWDEFYEHWDELPYQSETMLAKLKNSSIEKVYRIPEEELPKQGIMRERLIRARVNQSFFRSSILAAYNGTCCITGLQVPELLVAGHIRPWATDEKNRLNPQNGIAINGLHDKAFERGLITITTDYKVKVSKLLKKQGDSEEIKMYFLKYENKSIILPSRFLPDPEFLNYHNTQRFIA